jgi:hypothetical protein
MPAAVVPLHEPGHTIASAVDAFLTQADLADATRDERAASEQQPT